MRQKSTQFGGVHRYSECRRSNHRQRATRDGRLAHDYRTWAHVRTVLVGPQSAFAANRLGLHDIYANPAAVEDGRTGKFPDGSILVYDLLEPIEAGRNSVEGPQRRVDVKLGAPTRRPRLGFRAPCRRRSPRDEGSSLYCLSMEAERIDREEIEREVRHLTDEYRSRCLWFLRPDLYPATDAETLRVLRQIESHADRAGFIRASKVRRWLSPISSGRFAGS